MYIYMYMPVSLCVFLRAAAPVPQYMMNTLWYLWRRAFKSETITKIINYALHRQQK